MARSRPTIVRRYTNWLTETNKDLEKFIAEPHTPSELRAAIDTFEKDKAKEWFACVEILSKYIEDASKPLGERMAELEVFYMTNPFKRDTRVAADFFRISGLVMATSHEDPGVAERLFQQRMKRMGLESLRPKRRKNWLPWS